MSKMRIVIVEADGDEAILGHVLAAVPGMVDLKFTEGAEICRGAVALKVEGAEAPVPRGGDGAYAASAARLPTATGGESACIRPAAACEGVTGPLTGAGEPRKVGRPKVQLELDTKPGQAYGVRDISQMAGITETAVYSAMSYAKEKGREWANVGQYRVRPLKTEAP